MIAPSRCVEKIGTSAWNRAGANPSSARSTHPSTIAARDVAVRLEEVDVLGDQRSRGIVRLHRVSEDRVHDLLMTEEEGFDVGTNILRVLGSGLGQPVGRRDTRRLGVACRRIDVVRTRHRDRTDGGQRQHVGTCPTAACSAPPTGLVAAHVAARPARTIREDAHPSPSPDSTTIPCTSSTWRGTGTP